MSPASIDVSRLPNLVTGPRAPVWWGMVLLLAIESMVFGTLIVSYFYIRMYEPEWPPAGIEPPKLGLATANTVLLLASSAVVYLADRAIGRDNDRALAIGMIGAAVMGALFLVLKAVEYSDVPYAWDDLAYGSIIWLMVGFHSAHVMSVLLKAAVVGTLAWLGFFNRERRLGVQVNGLYWHFVVAVWLPLYAVIYWAPRAL